MRRYNHDNLWLHARTSAKLLGSIRRLQPAKVSVSAFWSKAALRKWGLSRKQLKVARLAYKLIHEAGMLGMPVHLIQVGFLYACH